MHSERCVPIQLHICQVIRIWQVTPVFLYFLWHLKFSPVFTRILIKSPAFCLMEMKLPRQIFRRKKREILVLDLSTFDQIGNLISVGNEVSINFTPCSHLIQ